MASLRLYEKLRPGMQHGDVIAFSGKGRLSELIKWKTSSEFSHVGLVWRKDFGAGWGDTLLLIESTTLQTAPDLLFRDCIKGVQMHRLAEVLAAYRGSASWCGLRQPLDPAKQIVADEWLRTTHERRTKYDTLQAIGAGIDWWDKLGFRNDPDFDRLFCSELVGRYHQLAGLWPEDDDMSEKTPEDVARAHYLLPPQLIMEGK